MEYNFCCRNVEKISCVGKNFCFIYKKYVKHFLTKFFTYFYSIEEEKNQFFSSTRMVSNFLKSENPGSDSFQIIETALHSTKNCVYYLGKNESSQCRKVIILRAAEVNFRRQSFHLREFLLLHPPHITLRIKTHQSAAWKHNPSVRAVEHISSASSFEVNFSLHVHFSYMHIY